MKRNSLLLFFLLSLLVQSCQFDEASAGTLDTKPFFDLSGYVDTELERTTWRDKTVTKTVTIGDKTETKQLQKADLSKDLALFAKADINKPAWIDKYRLETEGNDTTYIATDPGLRTQRLQVLRDEQNQVERIEILRSSGNILSSGGQELTYRPTSGYRIYSNQVGDLVGSAKVSVEVEW